jgi:hypothetical protein
MVSSNDIADTKQVPEYDLNQVHAHVATGDVHFMGGRKLPRHLSKLGIPFDGDTEAICELLACLTPGHFHRCERYSDDKLQLWHDVYLFPSYRAPNGCDYDMYIKIRMTRNGETTILCSFHPEGWE